MICVSTTWAVITLAVDAWIAAGIGFVAAALFARADQ
jgi:hypothetical protein